MLRVYGLGFSVQGLGLPSNIVVRPHIMPDLRFKAL